MNTLTYIIYTLISSTVIIYIGNACYTNGKIYISNYFYNDEKFANSINITLRTAYYLLNIGMVVWSLSTFKIIPNYETLVIEIASRLSFMFFSIALLHNINLITIYKLHKHFKNRAL